MSDISTKELCDRYSNIYPGAVADVLDDRGFQDQVLDPEITPLSKEMTIAGEAYPVVGRPNRSVDPEKNIKKLLEMFGDVPEDSVLMYQSNDDSFAHIGDLSANSMNARGVRGAVIDGGARDVAKILEIDFPVFRRYNTPADAVPRWEPIDWGVKTVVGGVEVKPGDIVTGNVDGVVVVPEDICEEVLLEAEEIVNTENKVRKAVKDGADPLEAYEKYGKF